MYKKGGNSLNLSKNLGLTPISTSRAPKSLPDLTSFIILLNDNEPLFFGSKMVSICHKSYYILV